MRLKANLIPRSVDPLRVIDIVGLARQADGGTHVASTREVGRVRVLEANHAQILAGSGRLQQVE